MAGIIYADTATIEATSGHMQVTFSSGGDQFRFHLPAHVAINLREKVMRDGWQVLCAPDAEVVALSARRARARREARAKREA